MIRGIIFDCFGVLYHGSLGYLRDSVTPDQLPELNDLINSYDFGYINRSDYFDRVGRLIHRTPQQVDEICQTQHVRNEQMTAFVRQLRPQYKTALLSNMGRGSINQLFRPDELAGLFDVEVLSSEVGMIKPNQEIYEIAAQKLGLMTDECIVVDDTPSNVEGARLAGMQAVLYQTTDQAIADVTALLGHPHA